MYFGKQGASTSCYSMICSFKWYLLLLFSCILFLCDCEFTFSLFVKYLDARNYVVIPKVHSPPWLIWRVVISVCTHAKVCLSTCVPVDSFVCCPTGPNTWALCRCLVQSYVRPFEIMTNSLKQTLLKLLLTLWGNCCAPTSYCVALEMSADSFRSFKKNQN